MLSKLAHMFACGINVSPIVVSLKMQFICEHCYIHFPLYFPAQALSQI